MDDQDDDFKAQLYKQLQGMPGRYYDPNYKPQVQEQPPILMPDRVPKDERLRQRDERRRHFEENGSNPELEALRMKALEQLLGRQEPETQAPAPRFQEIKKRMQPQPEGAFEVSDDPEELARQMSARGL